ncbi:hypothetical protein METHP14_20193 [Pseudomonas sp. P14-2025]
MVSPLSSNRRRTRDSSPSLC